MYLERLYIENYGSIKILDIKLPFNEENNPKPIVFVGKNGSGKTLTISAIVDSFYEFAKIGFDNIFSDAPLNSPLYRIAGGDNISIGEKYSLCYLNFKTETTNLEFLEKVGDITNEYIQTNFTKTLTLNENNKTVTNNKTIISDEFNKNIVCFFPSNRYEQPHWFNSGTNLQTEYFDFNKKYANKLNKPILIQNSQKDNFKWFLDLFLDSKAEVVINTEKNTYDFVDVEAASNNIIFRKGIENIEKILNLILEESDIKLSSGYRFRSRLALTKDKKVILPSINNLSTGQTLLFNMFATIIRYADMTDLNNSFKLNDIKGVVVIDEVDVHLHNDLLLSVLPNLIKLFPKVQFIMTTHSPLFLMGMDKVCGEDSYSIYDLNEADYISSERFKEFETAYKHFSETKKYETDFVGKVKELTKPVLYVEGDYDIRYINYIAEKLDKKEILEKIEIIDGDGSGNLKNLWKIFDSAKAAKISKLITNQKILFLFDCDKSESERDIENKIFKLSIPSNNSKLIKIGIENLLSNNVIQEALIKGYIEHSNTTKTVGEITETIDNYELVKNKKSNLCNWFCTERENSPEDIKAFSVIFEIIESKLLSI